MVNQGGVVGVVCLVWSLWEGQAFMAKKLCSFLLLRQQCNTKSTFRARVPRTLLHISCTYRRLRARLWAWLWVLL